MMQPGKMNVTLAAYYGDKPPLIAKLIRDAISELSSLLGNGFAPYALQQVHGTIFGLEGRRTDQHIINTNYAELCDELRPMDLKAALQILKEKPLLPFDVINWRVYRWRALFIHKSRWVGRSSMANSQSQLISFVAHEPVCVPISRSILREVAYVDEILTPETNCSYTLKKQK
jgi:hypothetical protein